MRERAGFCSSREDPLDKASQPLAGKRIVVTRAPEQAGELIRELERLGAEVLILPTVSFAPPEDWRANWIRRSADLDEFDGCCFLARMQYAIFSSVPRIGIQSEAMHSDNRSIAAVGPATAQAAAEAGVRVDYVAQNHTGESLAAELRDFASGRSVLLPRSDRARRSLAEFAAGSAERR